MTKVSDQTPQPAVITFTRVDVGYGFAEVRTPRGREFVYVPGKVMKAIRDYAEYGSSYDAAVVPNVRDVAKVPWMAVFILAKFEPDTCDIMKEWLPDAA